MSSPDSSAGSAPRDGGPAVAGSLKRPSSATPSASSILPKMSDPPPAAGQGSTASQSATPTGSSSASNPLSKDTVAGSTASPYGTRSRNRTGASRPNYAEDKDIDMEIFEMYPERRDDDARKSARHTNHASPTSNGGALDTPRSSTAAITNSSAAPVSNSGSSAAAVATTAPAATVTSRKPLPSDSKHASSQQPHHQQEHQQHQQHQNHHQPKENHSASVSGASATNGTHPPPSKKRKGAAQVNSGTAPSGSHGSSSRRNGNTSQGIRGYAETNILTFDSCRARPNKDGKMVADDGTVISVNGESPESHCRRPGRGARSFPLLTRVARPCLSRV